MSGITDARTATEPAAVIPPDAGLDQGTRPGDAEREPRSGDDLIAAAARGDDLVVKEQQDLLDYFLTNGELPGDTKPHPLEWTVGDGPAARKSVWQVRRIGWEEWQDSRERATDEKTGVFDAYVSASWVVGRALLQPQLGPKIQRLQREAGDKAPQDAAALLRRMFRKQSGVLLEISGEVLRISKLQADNGSVRSLDEEVEAGKT
jgi:hypothetical protein